MWRYPRWPLADISLATSNVCFRSKADMTVASQNVRLDPKRTNRPSAAPTVLSGGGMSDRAHGGFGVDDLTRLLGDRKSQKVFDFRVHAVSSKNAVKPRTLVECLRIRERLPLVNSASDPVLVPDELLADESLFLRKAGRDFVEVRKAFVLANSRGQLVANDRSYHGDLLPGAKVGLTPRIITQVDGKQNCAFIGSKSREFSLPCANIGA